MAHHALERNRAAGRPGRVTCIEPYPERRLTEAGIAMELVREPVERVPLERFTELQEGDVLFIDSSHVVRFGGDVCREFLDILPAVQPGVWIHVHDIFFPHDYPAEWLMQRRLAFTEQYLLEAFLALNPNFRVEAANHWLLLDHPDAVAALCPEGTRSEEPARTSSFWMRRV